MKSWCHRCQLHLAEYAADLCPVCADSSAPARASRRRALLERAADVARPLLGAVTR